MSIKLTLPRTCTGREILDAFRAAATFQETPERKWEVHSYALPCGVATAENTFMRMRGYYATPAYLQKQGRISRLFNGPHEEKWVTMSGGDVSRFATQIKLLPLQPEARYNEVEMAFSHLGIGPEWDQLATMVRVISSPNDQEASVFRPAYDRIVRDLLRRLNVTPASAT